MASNEATWRGLPATYWINRLEDGDDHERWEAIDAIRHLLRPVSGIPFLRRSLRDKNSRCRALAMHAFQDIAYSWDAEPESQRAELERVLSDCVADVVASMKDDDPAIRFASAEVIGLLGPRIATNAVPALIEALQDSTRCYDEAVTLACTNGNDQVATAAASALRRFGSLAAAASTALKDLLNADDENLRHAAEEALLAIDTRVGG